MRCSHWRFRLCLLTILSLLGVTSIQAQSEHPNVSDWGNDIVGGAARFTRGIRLRSDSEQIHVGDSFNVDVEWVDLYEPPDITPLLQDTKLIRETRGIRVGLHDSRVVELPSRRLVLQAQEPGTLTLGPLHGFSQNGQESSNTLQLNVLPLELESWSVKDTDLNVEVTLSNDQVRVGQATQLDIILQQHDPIVDEVLELPKLNTADLVAIFEGRRTSDERGVRTRHWRYLLFPRISGPLDATALQWRGELVRSRHQRAQFERQAALPTLEVLPPTDHSSWWLPVDSLQLDEVWSADPEKLLAGDEVVRTLRLRARGVQAHQLPSFSIPASVAHGIRALPEQRSQRIVDEHTLEAQLQQDLIISTFSAEPLLLDTVRVEYWDIEQGKDRAAILPPRRIELTPTTEGHRIDAITRDKPWRKWWSRLESAGEPVWLLVLSLACSSLLWLLWREHRWRQQRNRLPPL